MVQFAVIKEKDAPKSQQQAGGLAQRMREYEAYVSAIADGGVGKLIPAEGETARSVALRISRAARRINATVDAWIVDGVVYFRSRSES